MEELLVGLWPTAAAVGALGARRQQQVLLQGGVHSSSSSSSSRGQLCVARLLVPTAATVVGGVSLSPPAR
jgi:hypothetical protein